MKKLLVRLTVLLVAVFMLGSIAAWLLLRGSLPTLDGTEVVAGLSADASIARDAAGIPVITASNRLDLAFATGFAHGQDRFFQMDLIRRQAAGELSELVGSAALPLDKRNRFHRFRARSVAILAEHSASERSILQRYADGVNAGRDSLSAKPFEYFVLNATPQDWRAQDSILAVYAMYMQLNDSTADKEVRRGRAHSVLPAEVFEWLYPQGTKWDAPIMGEARESLPIPGPDVYSIRDVADRAPAANERGRPVLPGSNNWAVSGALTKDGRALVSNDMHLGLNTPNIYYRARLIVEGASPVDVSGVTLPGAPFVVAGSNSQVAWGYTNSYGDYTDAVLLKPGASEGTYASPDGDQSFVIYKEQINVKDGDPVLYEIRETIWGPVLDDIDYPDGKVAVSWIAHKPGAINLNLLKLEHVTSVAEALDVANTMAMPPQNFVTGDADGNTGWTIAGKIPSKRSFDTRVPADWSERAGWLGWVLPSAYPRVVNPDSHRIWTANARVADGEALAIIGDGGYDLGARARQIRDGLYAKESFVAEDMLAIQYDDRAIFLAPWRDLLLTVLSDEQIQGDSQLAEYRRLVASWIPRAAPESTGYRLVRAFRLEIERRVFHALMAPVREAYGEDVRLKKSNQFEGVLWALVTERPMHLLPVDYASWDEFLLAAVQQNIDYFTENFDGPLADRRWGEVNTAAIRHPLGNSIPFFGQYLNMPADEMNGDADLPKAQGAAFGASERFSVSPGNEAQSLLHMPTGASGHPLSAFYDAGHASWVDGTPSPFLPGQAIYTLTLSAD